MMFNLELCDKDVQFIDDTSLDIIIDNDIPLMNTAKEGDIVDISYDEDKGSVTHRYTVSKIDNNKIYLIWKSKKEHEILTEANPFKALKDKIAPDQATKLANAAKSAEKQANKVNKKATNLYARDVKEGQNWKFYLQLPDGSLTKKPMSYNDVQEMYTSNNIGPWLINAVVTTDTGFIVRRGKEDLDKQGIRFSTSTSKILPKYEQQWTDEDKSSFKLLTKENTAIANIVKASKQDSVKKDSSNKSRDDKNVETNKQDKVETEEPVNKSEVSGITPKLLDKFADVAKATGLKVVDNDMKQVSNVNSITPQTASDYWVIVNNKEFELDKWLLAANKQNIITEDCDVHTFDAEKVLVESPIITLDDADVMNPSNIDFKEKGRKAAQIEAEKKASEAKAKKEAELKEKYEHVEVALKEAVRMNHLPMDILDMLFNKLVPPQGEAETVAGELVRAIVRILYRDNNDGDKFFEGYGIETCGSSAEYLFDNGFAEQIEHILDMSYLLSSDDDKYTAAIENLAGDIVDHIKTNTHLLYELNETDSRDYSTEYIEENQPRYEFEVYGSDDVVTLVDNGVIDAWKLNEYVEHVLEFERVYDGAEVGRPWSHNSTTVTVENLTKDGYDRLEDSFNRDPDAFWSDLVSEYADELDNDTYDDDYSIDEE